MSRLPLESVRVADFGQVVAVPYAAQLLTWLGAEVILIESEERLTTRILPPFVDGVPGADRSGLFNTINTNKIGCTINVARPEGAELARRIVAVSDVMVENYTTGTLDRFGLGYEEVPVIPVRAHSSGREGPRTTGPRCRR